MTENTIPPEDTKTPPNENATPPNDPPSSPPADSNDEPPVAEVQNLEVKPGEDDVDFLDSQQAKTYVNKQVIQATDGLRKTVMQERINVELGQILSSNPEYKPYEQRIRRWVNHPNRRQFIESGLPLQSVVLEAVSPYLSQIAIDKAKQADQEAASKTTQTSTVTPKAPSGQPDFKSMTSKEITEMGELVKSGRYAA